MGKPQSNTAEFIVKATKFHGGKYDYSKVEYITQHTILTIICPEHGEFQQTAKQHLKSGCNKCAQEIRMASVRLSRENAIERAISIHGNKYNYDKVQFLKVHDKVEIICHKHGSFLQRLYLHMLGQNCPRCVKNISDAETEWLDSLKITIRRNVRITTSHNFYYADGFDPNTNTVYEFHGDYWHGNPQIYKEESINKRTKTTFGELYQWTLEKEQNIKNAGFNLIVMWENDWNMLKKAHKAI